MSYLLLQTAEDPTSAAFKPISAYVKASWVSAHLPKIFFYQRTLKRCAWLFGIHARAMAFECKVALGHFHLKFWLS